jgi:hypothetical protein
LRRRRSSLRLGTGPVIAIIDSWSLGAVPDRQ